jgi:hypothetical protein
MKKNISLILFSIGIGNFIFFYLINNLKNNIIPQKENMIQKLSESNLNIYAIECISVGYVFLLLSLISSKIMTKHIKILILIFIQAVIFYYLSFVAVFITEGKHSLFEFILLISVIVIVYVICKFIYDILFLLYISFIRALKNLL